MDIIRLSRTIFRSSGDVMENGEDEFWDDGFTPPRGISS